VAGEPHAGGREIIREHLLRVIALLAAFVLVSFGVLLSDAPLWSKLVAAVLALVGLSLVALWLPLPPADWRARRGLRIFSAAMPLALAALVIGFGLAFWPPGQSPIPNHPATLVLLDASDGMKESLPGGGEPKFKAAMQELEEERRVPEDGQLGLATFGIERCNLEGAPVDEVVSIAPGGAERIRKKADDLTPGGQANLVSAARYGIGLLGPFTGPRNVVVITSGLDTCEGDLGELLSESEIKGVSIRWELVGLGLTADEKERAQSLPDDVTVHLADTPEELKEALEFLLFEKPVRDDLEQLRDYVERSVRERLNLAIAAVNANPPLPGEAGKQLALLSRLATEGDERFAELGTSEGSCDFALVERLLQQQFGHLLNGAESLRDVVEFDRDHGRALGDAEIAERDVLVAAVSETVDAYNANVSQVVEEVEAGLNQCFRAI
jgi:hypothetical protein